MSNRRRFPFKLHPLDEESSRKMVQSFTGHRNGYVQVGPKKYIFPAQFAQLADDLYNFEVRVDDVWIVTFPRSGTTWVQEMVWLLCNHFDYDQASRVQLTERSPFFEFGMLLDPQLKLQLLEANRDDVDNLQRIQNMDQQLRHLSTMAGRRIIKSHLPFSLLPPEVLTSGCKVIYVARNPRDVAVSYYHHNRLLNNVGCTSDWPTYWDLFADNLIPYTPYWLHLEEGCAQRSNPNVLFLFYEQLNRNLGTALQSIAKFLNVPLGEAESKHLQTHLHIDNFRKNPAVNLGLNNVIGLCRSGEEGFVRQGRTAASDAYFTKEVRARYARWIEENRKQTLQLVFPL